MRLRVNAAIRDVSFISSFIICSFFWPLAHMLEQDLINMFVLGWRGYASGECAALLCDIFIRRAGFSGSPKPSALGCQLVISGGCIKSEKGFVWIFDTSGSMRAVLWNLAHITLTREGFVCVCVCLDVNQDM